MTRDGEPDELAASRTLASRDRGRVEEALLEIERAHARIEALEGELAALRASFAWRLTSPLRRLAACLPPDLYATLRRTSRLSGPGSGPAATAPIGGERAVALLIDDWFPAPDRDSGSIDIVNMAEGLSALGFSVVFAARLDDGPTRCTALRTHAVHMIGAGDTPNLETFLRANGRSLALVVLNRVYCGGVMFETVRRLAPRARIVFNTVDLHWIRIAREAALSDDDSLRQVAIDVRVREIQLARETDATIVVSEAERDILRTEAPGAIIVTLPLARPAAPPVAGFGRRDGIGFIGGFRHAPNRDAIVWFTREVWPLVTAALPGCRLSIVGPDLPDALLDGLAGGAPGNVEILGHLPDIGPWFERLRLTVAPLRFGAGAKGKLVSSLAAGVPCVATAIAVEGMGLHEDDGVIAADTPDAMARAIVSLHQDPARWDGLSAAACRTVQTRFSRDEWNRLLAAMLDTLGVLSSPREASRS